MDRMKKTVRFIFVLLLLSNLFNVKLYAQSDTMSFLHITDTHLIFDWNLIHNDLVRDRTKYGEGLSNFKQFLYKTAKKVDNDFVAITGDVFDSYEVQRTDGSMLSFDARSLNKLLKKSKSPVYMLLGNHDVVSYKWKDDGREAMQLQAQQAQAKWTRSFACFQNGTYYSQIYKVGETTFRLIYLDNAYVKFPPEEKVSVPYIEKPQIHWLKSQLDESPDDIEIILMHLPFKADDPLLQTSGLYNTLVNSTARLMVTGHAHKNMVVRFDGMGGNTLTQVQTGTLFRNGNNWRRITLTENNILISQPGTTENLLTIPCR